MRPKKQLFIEKQATTATTTDFDVASNEYFADTETDAYKKNNQVQNAGTIAFKSIVKSGYKKPSGGTKQENYTISDIKEKLVGYIPLKSMKEKQYLTKLPYFKTWIKYFNTDTKQFRTGGLLMKVVYPDYIMLVNTSQKITWSVQLKNNIIYVPDPNNQTTTTETTNDIDYKKEQLIKEKLFEMYKRGRLTTK
jgi:hypothetical protein